MSEPSTQNVHVASLISQARLKLGFVTLKDLYRNKKPAVDYQTWLHTEAGRRIPTPAKLVQMGDLLGIDRENLLLAYCKDKFPDPESLNVIETFQYRKFANPDTLVAAREHDRADDYVFTSEQVSAMQNDIRLRLYLNYTYDVDDKTTKKRFAEFFKVSISEVEEVLNKLYELGLVQIDGEQVVRIYRHSTLPRSVDVFDLRRSLLLKNLEINISAESYISNCHAMITESSYKKILNYLDFAEASLLKLDREDEENTERSHFQIALIANRVKESIDDPR